MRLTHLLVGWGTSGVLGVLAVGCGPTSDDYEWRQLPLEDNGLVWEVVVDQPNHPLVITDAGLARYDGVGLALLDPQPPCAVPNGACPLRADKHGTIYVGMDRFPVGATAWESIAIPAVTTSTTPWPASDGALYVSGTPDGQPEDTRRIYRRGPGDTAWKELGPPGLATERFFADAHGNMWFDQPGYLVRDEADHSVWKTTQGTVYRASASGVEYIGPNGSDNPDNQLRAVDADGQLFFTLPFDVWACGIVFTRPANGAASEVSHGECIDSEDIDCRCAPGNGILQQLEVDADGALWAHWRNENTASAEHLLHVLRPGTASWEPVDWGPGHADFQSFTLDEDRIWVISNQQVATIGDGGYTNWVYGGLWVRERKDAPSRAP